MPLGCKIGEKTVRFDDLTPQAWMEIGRASEKGEWARVYVAPMADLSGAIAIVCECVKVAEPNEGEPMARALALTDTLAKLDACFLTVDEDLPTQWEDSTPKAGDVTSTPS